MIEPFVLTAILALPSSAVAEGLRFREVSAAWGLSFRHHHGGSGSFYMPETMGSGVVVFDYDGDGDQDVFWIDSGKLPGYEGEEPRSVLHENDGRGRFTDVTARSRLQVSGYGMGATAGDVDGDGDVDLYVTAFGPDQLFRNEGDGTFTDVTARAGLGNPLWGASAAFADADRDGDLDLYVTNYVDFSFDNNPLCGHKEKGLRSYCHPDVYKGLPDRFYRNRGDGTFEDRTREAGFGGATGNGMGAVWSDLDGDGWQDLYVANDMTPNFLFHNQGDGAFEEIGVAAGAALGDQGQPEAGMGVAVGDVDGNGLPEIVVTNLDLQTNALYSNLGGMLFTDGRFAAKIAEASNKVGFGAALGDFDQDADLDLSIANGHIIHNVELFGTGTTYKQKNQLFENMGKGAFRELSASGLDVVRSSRGLALGDLDGDGDLDLAISNSNDLCEVYENVSSPEGHWLQVDGPAVGARLELAAGGKTQTREVRTASSYLSQSATTVHFGLGQAGTADLTVRHAAGIKTVKGIPAGRRVVVR